MARMDFRLCDDETRKHVDDMIRALKQISAMRIPATGIPAVADMSADDAQRLAEVTLRSCGVYA